MANNKRGELGNLNGIGQQLELNTQHIPYVVI